MNQREGYRADIDGLRAVAILAVIFFHAFPSWVKGGFIGVDIFFVISGFLISSILIENLEKNQFSFTDFYIKRINRIFPALILVLISCLVFGWFALLPIEYKQLGSHVAGGASFISNLLLWYNTGYFDNAAESKPLLHLWSLGIEEQFYIVWPILLWVAWKKQFNLMTIIILISTISFVINIKEIHSDKVATFFSPQTRFWELLLGSILSYLHFYKSNALNEVIKKFDDYLLKIVYRTPQEANGVYIRHIFSVLGLLIIVYGLAKITKETNFPGARALFPTLGAFLLILSGAEAWVNKFLLSNRFMVWIGLISYPLYLWHWPLLSFARIMEENTPTRNIRIIVVIISVALAWLTYLLIEKPFRLSQSKKINAFFLMAIMSVLGCFGVFIWLSNGFDFRLSKKHMAVQAIISNPQPPVEKYFECSDSIPLFKKFKFNGLCHLTKETAPEIIFIGDSHTLHYRNAVWQQFPTKSVLMIVQTSCLPFSSNYFLKGDCKDKYGAIISFLESNNTIKQVYLSGYWSYLMTGGFGEEGLNWRHAKPLDVEESKSFIENGKHFIAKITQTNKEIIFLKDIPDLDFNIQSCFNTRPLRLSQATINKTCGVDFTSYKQRMVDYNKVIDQILADFPKIKIYDPIPLFCKKNKCIGRDDSLPYYMDGDHLNYYGANMVIKDMLDKTTSKTN